MLIIAEVHQQKIALVAQQQKQRIVQRIEEQNKVIVKSANVILRTVARSIIVLKQRLL